MGLTTDRNDPGLKAIRSDGQQEKICNRCGEQKPLTGFGVDRSRPSGRHSICLTCNAKRTREAFAAKGREGYLLKKQRVETRRREITSRVYRYLLEHHCVDCGESDPIVLDFDHVRGEKIAAISKLVMQSRKWDVIAAEICKCDVRCANCHRRKTAKELNWYSYIPEVKHSTGNGPAMFWREDIDVNHN